MAIRARQARSWASLRQSCSASMVQKLAPRDAARSAEGIDTSDRNGRRIQLCSSLLACGAAWNVTTTGGDRGQAVETGAAGGGELVQSTRDGRRIVVTTEVRANSCC